MKRVVAGGMMLLSGAVLYAGVHVAAALYLPDVQGWSTPPGRFETALSETGGTAARWIAVLLGGAGLLLMLWESGLRGIAARSKARMAQRDAEFRQEYGAGRK